MERAQVTGVQQLVLDAAGTEELGYNPGAITAALTVIRRHVLGVFAVAELVASGTTGAAFYEFWKDHAADEAPQIYRLAMEYAERVKNATQAEGPRP